MTTHRVMSDNLIHSFVFCSWDNVVGPKILKTWSASSFEVVSSCDVVDEVGVEIGEGRVIESDMTAQEKNSSFHIEDDQIAKYISVHTLTGHLAKAKHTDYEGINDVCLTVPALGFTSQTATFYCLYLPEGNLGNFCTDEPWMSSLSVVFHYECLNEFWKFQPLVLHLLKKTVDRLKVGLSQDLNYYEQPLVSKWLAEVYNELMDTQQLQLMHSQLTSPISLKKMLNNHTIAWDVVITSMLTTSGSCCVVGRNEDYINRIIDLLAFFLPENQQFSCSRYAADDFSSGLYLQGLLENANGIRKINSADILLNEFPLTLFDLSHKGKVKFSGHLYEHYRSKQRQLREQEFSIIQRKEPDIPYTTESVFRSFGESSRYVRWCLEQLATHNAEHWSRIISAFHQALALQAHDVIKAFQSKNFTGDGLKSMRVQLKKSMKMTEADFWLLVSTAERLKPGFCQVFANYKFA